MHVTDWLPTFLSMAGSNAVADISKSIDGIDQWASLRYNKPSPREELLYNIAPNTDPKVKKKLNNAAIRQE